MWWMKIWISASFPTLKYVITSTIRRNLIRNCAIPPWNIDESPSRSVPRHWSNNISCWLPNSKASPAIWQDSTRNSFIQTSLTCHNSYSVYRYWKQWPYVRGALFLAPAKLLWLQCWYSGSKILGSRFCWFDVYFSLSCLWIGDIKLLPTRNLSLLRISGVKLFADEWIRKFFHIYLNTFLKSIIIDS